MLTETKIENFLMLAQELNFSRAAAKLFITQQTLSAQIASMEEDLGGELFHRTTKKVELTPMGEELQKLFTRSVYEYHRIIDRYASSDRQLLRICCLEDMDIAKEIHEAKKALLENYPGMQFRILNTDNFQGIQSGLELGEFDVAIFPEGVRLSNRKYNIMQLNQSDQLFACLSPRLCKDPQHPTVPDLKDVVLYAGTDTETVRPIVDDICSRYGVKPRYYEGDPLSPSIERMMIEGGEGAGLGGRFSVLNRNPHLVKIEMGVSAVVIAAWKKNGPPCCQEFASNLRAQMSE